ncbi:MAG: signal peptidase I [Planctomycetes bacterium]|nr:signal peptidase I [Planctomycetota bacterium]
MSKHASKRKARAGAPAPAAEKDRTAPRQDRKKDSTVSARAPALVRGIVDNVEALVVALLMALIVRQFVLEAFTIPSDSMYPTLNGEPGWLEGDRVIVDKWALLLGEPRRWDVTVFRYPLDIRRNFIKRLVGMPGERLTVADGDIWINQKIERKPATAQRSIWVERFPQVPRFALPPDRGRFQLASDGWKGSADRFAAAPAAGETLRLAFDFGSPVPLSGPIGPTYEDVRDYRLRGEVTAAEGAELGVEMAVRDLVFQVTLAAGGGASRVAFERDRYPLARVEEPGKELRLPADRAVRFEVAHWDWRFEVRVGGAVWFAYELDPRPWTITSKGEPWPRMFPVKPTALALTARGGPLALARLAVDQDIHYTQPGDGASDTVDYTFEGRPLADGKIPDGHYFMMGDNSAGSRDSRLWHRILMRDPVTGEPMKHADGTPVWGEEYTWGLDSDHMFNENTTNFVDMWGNGYWIPGYDRRGPTDRALNAMIVAVEPFGLIPRHHLVGRAFLVFWPPRSIGAVR